MTHEDYHRSHLLLQPQGAAWSKESGGLYSLSLALTKPFHRLDESGDALMGEFTPETSTQLLDEYEKAFGLPECSQLSEQTIQARRDALYAKDTHEGGLSAIALEELCAEYGFDVSITITHRHHCLRSCIYPIYPDERHFYITAHVKSTPVTRMSVLDNCLTPLVTIDELAVTCILDKYVLGGWEVIYIFAEE